MPQSVECWGICRARVARPVGGQPVHRCDVQRAVHARASQRDVDGFYDGDGIYRVRFMPDEVGEWRYATRSNRRAGRPDGRVHLRRAGAGQPRAGARARHVPLRLCRRHAVLLRSGRPATPGLTRATRWRTDARDAEPAPFNKMRMCVFPKDYDYNKNEPEYYPFERDAAGAGTSRASTRRSSAILSGGSPTCGAGHRGRHHPLPPLRPLGLRHHGRRDRRPLPPLPGRPAVRLSQRLVVAGQRIRPDEDQDDADWDRFFRIVQECDPYGTCARSTTATSSTTTPSRG